MDSKAELLQEISGRRRSWFGWHVGLNALNYTLGILVIIASVLAGTLQRGGRLQVAATVITAICGAVLSFVNPAKLSLGYLKAWRHLDSAIRRYGSAPADSATLDPVNDAIDEGELMIADSQAAATTTEKAVIAALVKERKKQRDK